MFAIIQLISAYLIACLIGRYINIPIYRKLYNFWFKIKHKKINISDWKYGDEIVLYNDCIYYYIGLYDNKWLLLCEDINDFTKSRKFISVLDSGKYIKNISAYNRLNEIEKLKEIELFKSVIEIENKIK